MDISVVAFHSAGTGGQMSFIRKPFEELDIMDDFLMNAVATNEEVGIPFCRTILSVLLQRKIGKIRIVAQRTLPALTPTLRGIRMDVEIEEFGDDADVELPGMNIYDLEPHLQQHTDLAKHNRFYQAKIDSRYLKSGETNFSKMPNLYVITITNYDPFGYDYMMYTFHNKCEEVPDLNYKDGLEFIYFNTVGTKGGNPEIKALLNYFKKSTINNVTDKTTKEVNDYINKVKILPEVKVEYMKFEEIIYYAKRDASIDAEKRTRVLSILELLEDYGDIPEELHQRLNTEDSPEILKKWLKLAAKSASIQEFISNM